LEAKLLLAVPDEQLRKVLRRMNPLGRQEAGGTSPTGEDKTIQHVDELRYLFLTSQVEVLDSVDLVVESKYQTQTETVAIAVVDAEGHKCDRCWNYSIHVGESTDHPLLCERCIPALEGYF
jgi:isoleucyl-tRNA synthetase